MNAKDSEKRIIKGDLSTLLRISLPIFLFLFCESLTLFCERIFLSYYSIEGVASSLNANYLAQVFQRPCIAFGAIGQIFVGLYYGNGDYKKIGPCVWQLIWFSLFSFLITLPLSYGVSRFFFKSTIIEQAGTEYFMVLSLGNFLFPLSTVLSSFYLGRGRTALVTSSFLVSYALQVFLSWAFIFGWGLFPTLGIRGAPLSKCLSLAVLSLYFFFTFLRKKYREKYQTDLWKFSPSIFWEYLRPGIVRAFSFFFVKLQWAIITYILIQKGGEYLDVLTVGGTLTTFLVFFTVGVYQSVLTIGSNLLGAKNYTELHRLCHTSLVYSLIISAILAIPLLIFPQFPIIFFDLSLREVFNNTFATINFWIWTYITALCLQIGIFGFIVAARDLRGQLYACIFSFLTALVPVYLFMHLGDLGANKLWFLMTLESVTIGLFYYFRFRKRYWISSSELFQEPSRRVIEEL